MAERVGARVAEGCRVLRAAAADGIEDDEDGAGHVTASTHRLILRSDAKHRVSKDDPEARSRSGALERGAHWLTTPVSVASLAKAAANRARV